MPHHNTVKRNAIFLSKANSVKHELSKCIGSIMLNRWGDLKFSEHIVKNVNYLANIIELNMSGFPNRKAEFITEACSNEEDRIIDLIRLEDNQRFEFETDNSVKKKNCITIYL